MDYFWRYVEVAKLTDTSQVYVRKTWNYLSDNGPQFSARFFAKFAEEYGFTHITTTPRYPQANDQVERAVQTVKNSLKKATDPYQALMAYRARATPLEGGISPAELLMGRKIHTRLPTLLIPSWSYLEQFREKDGSLKARRKENFDRRHAARPLPVITPGEHVWLPDQKIEGTLVHESGTPRSYKVKTPNSMLRRNKRHLIWWKEERRGAPPCTCCYHPNYPMRQPN